jgi:hypothetical protein
MSAKFTRNIAPYVRAEIQLANIERQKGNTSQEFFHLENAHVIGQSSTYWHVKVHIYMLFWAVRNAKFREFSGQMLRIVGAAIKTPIGFLPQGNTGGANVSPFKAMTIKPEHQEIINRAN